MTTDGFEATFRLHIDRHQAWQRLVGGADVGPGEQLWLPGFDSRATVVAADAPARLEATKDDEPCAGTDVVVVLEDEGTGTTVRVVQSGFTQVLGSREIMAVGWRFIVADLELWLATGVHARRHLRLWGDLGSLPAGADGAVALGAVRPGSLADRLGMAEGDLLVDLAGAPVASVDDLVTILRVADLDGKIEAAWIRDGELHSGNAAPVG